MPKKILKKTKEILFFTDNCGEIVFDKILCKEIKKKYPEIKITLVVKGEPILSDATIKDAEDLKFNEVVDKIITTGCYAVGVDFNQLPNKLENELKKTDFIIWHTS